MVQFKSANQLLKEVRGIAKQRQKTIRAAAFKQTKDKASLKLRY